MLKKICMMNMFLVGVSIINAAKEIEIKISVPADTYAHIESWLNDNAHYCGQTEQKEYYITHPDASWDYSAGFKDTLKTMRVRQEQTGDSFCYKYRHLDPITKKTSHRDEYETKIEDGNVMVTILKMLGYSQETLVAKKRRTYLVREKFEVALDDVHNVGTFIEIELKDGTKDVKLGIAQIEALLSEIGIAEFKQYDRSYIHMIWNPGYDFGIARSL